jgi:hypothetical protein
MRMDLFALVALVKDSEKLKVPIKLSGKSCAIIGLEIIVNNKIKNILFIAQ